MVSGTRLGAPAWVEQTHRAVGKNEVDDHGRFPIELNGASLPAPWLK